MRGSERRGISNVALGVIVAAVLVVAAYWAFTKAVPWGSGTEYQVVFDSAQNVRVDSPVRIAGVDVGKVAAVEPLAGGEADAAGADDTGAANGGEAGTLVTLQLEDEALPLKEDARFKLRPRLFLEGNLFVDVSPGSPSAPEQDSDSAFPPAQTENSVQLGSILTETFQRDSRRDLQVFLGEFGEALTEGGGAESFREFYRVSAGAFRSTSQVNEALRGRRQNDLSGLIRNLDKVVRGLSRNPEALRDLVTDLRVVSGSFAAQDAALEEAVIELPQVLRAADPALTNLNAAFPPVRALARELLPGVRSAPRTLDAATPLLRQVRLLSRKVELRGLARDLVPTVPNLAEFAASSPDFLEQVRPLSSCLNEVILPWSLDRVDGGPGYPYPAVGPVYKETAYGFAGIAGESRSQDANGPYIHVAGGGGPNVVTTPLEGGETLAGVTQFPLQGAMPARDASAKTPFRPGSPCENQESPDLDAGEPGPPPVQSRSLAPPVAVPGSEAAGEVGEIARGSGEAIDGLAEAAGLEASGNEKAAREKRREAKRLIAGLRREYGN